MENEKRVSFLLAGLAIGVIVGTLYSNRGRVEKLELPGRLKNGMVVQSVDCHCGGLPARVVVGGAPSTDGARSCMERRAILMKSFDWFRKIMITEPRGYPCQNVDIVYPKTKAHPEAEYSFVIGENNGIYPSMSGHNSICVITALLETGMVQMVEPVTDFKLEAPIGVIDVSARCAKGKVESVTFRNCPSFLAKRDEPIDVPTVGRVCVDIAFGGMWYCIVDLRHPTNAKNAELRKIAGLLPGQGGDIVRLGEMIKVACREQCPVSHPEIDYDGCDIMAFRCEPSEEGVRKHGASARNAVVMSTGKLDWENPSTWKGNIDRSPCGTGTCAIMASMYARGELSLNQSFVHESVMGSIFIGKLLSETTVGPYKALLPTITGSACITQISQVVIDPTDPFPEGYTCGDIWA